MTHYSDRDLCAATLLAVILMWLGVIWVFWFVIQGSTLCGKSNVSPSPWLGLLYFSLGGWLKWKVHRERRLQARENERAE